MPAMAAASKSAQAIDPAWRIIVIHGKEAFLREMWTQRIAEATREAHGDFEQFEFDGSSVSLAVVLDELRSWGLIQQHKLVVVDNAQDFMAGDGVRTAMERYAESPMAEATLLLRGESWRKGKFDKALDSVGTILRCDLPKEAEAISWCSSRAKSAHAAQLDRDAAQLLVARVGPILSSLDREIAKLAAAVATDAGTSRITAATVAEMVELSRDEQVWLIQDALLSGNRARALEKVEALYQAARTPSVLLMWAMTDLVRKLAMASRMADDRKPPQVIGKALGLWGPSARTVPQAAQRLGTAKASALFHSMLDADARAKTGRAPSLSDSPANRVATRRTLECAAVRIADSLG